MKKLSLKIGMVLLVAFLSAFVVAQPKGPQSRQGRRSMPLQMMHFAPGGGGFGHNVGMILRYKDKLELTDKQVEQLQAVKKEINGQFRARGQAVKDKRASLKRAMESGASETELRAIAADIGKAIGEQAVLAVSAKKKIDAVLTDEQKAKLKGLKAEKEQEAAKGKKDTEPTTSRRRGAGTAFSRIDTNGDGSISPDEFQAHMRRMREHGSERPRGPAGRRGGGY